MAVGFVEHFLVVVPETQECYEELQGVVHKVCFVCKINPYGYTAKAIKSFENVLIFVKSVSLIILTSLGF